MVTTRKIRGRIRQPRVARTLRITDTRRTTLHTRNFTMHRALDQPSTSPTQTTGHLTRLSHHEASTANAHIRRGFLAKLRHHGVGWVWPGDYVRFQRPNNLNRQRAFKGQRRIPSISGRFLNRTTPNRRNTGPIPSLPKQTHTSLTSRPQALGARRLANSQQKQVGTYLLWRVNTVRTHYHRPGARLSCVAHEAQLFGPLRLAIGTLRYFRDTSVIDLS